MSVSYPVPQLAPPRQAMPMVQRASFLPDAPPPAADALQILVMQPLAPPQGPRP